MARRMKTVIICGACIDIAILFLMGKRLFISYGLGFILGCINLASMAAFFNKMLSLKAVKVPLFLMLSYLIRYAMIALGMIKASAWGISGIILFTGGLLTVNYSYIVSSYSRNIIFQGK